MTGISQLTTACARRAKANGEVKHNSPFMVSQSPIMHEPVAESLQETSRAVFQIVSPRDLSGQPNDCGREARTQGRELAKTPMTCPVQ